MGSSLSCSGQYNVQTTKHSNTSHSNNSTAASIPNVASQINQKLHNLAQRFRNKPNIENKLIINSNEYALSSKINENCSYALKTNILNPCLIKKIQTQNEDLALSEKVFKELRLLRKLSSVKFSPLIRLLEFEIRAPQIYFIFENSLMPLSYFIDHFERDEAYTEICIKRIFILALKALLYLQHLNVVHGSLSGDSFFITFKKNGNFNLKLLDLNSIEDRLDQLNKRKYNAPEPLDMNKSSSYDCWSLGIILHKMIYDNQYPQRSDPLPIILSPIRIPALTSFTEILKSNLCHLIKFFFPDFHVSFHSKILYRLILISEQTLINCTISQRYSFRRVVMILLTITTLTILIRCMKTF